MSHNSSMWTADSDRDYYDAINGPRDDDEDPDNIPVSWCYEHHCVLPCRWCAEDSDWPIPPVLEPVTARVVRPNPEIWGEAKGDEECAS